MPYAVNDGVRIHYRLEGAGPPIVLQHWSLATMEDWYEHGYVSGLKDDYRLVLLDARGHGASDKPHAPEACELKNRIDDIVAVLDDVGIGRAHFFGYSMGGWIGFGMARFAPERLRSLIIGGQSPFAQNMDGLRQLVRYGVENGPEAFVAMWEENFGMLSSKARERMLSYDYDAFLAVAQDRDSLEPVLPHMKVPCLLYVGETDGVCSLVEECAKQMADVTLAILPGLDHGEAIRRSDKVLPHVRTFLAAVEEKWSEA